MSEDRVATDKPRLQGYVPRSVYDLFEAYREYRGMSQSEALEQAVIAFFGLSSREMKILEEWADQENRTSGQQALTILQQAIQDYELNC